MKLTSKSVLVTGGAGFIGSHLVDRIIQESPSNLVVVDNLFLGKETNLNSARGAFPAIKFYQQDVSDYAEMKKIVTREKVEVIFNLAVIPLPTSLEQPRYTVDTNVAIATVASELLREGFCKTLIHFSSSESYGTAEYVPMDELHPIRPSTPYAASKVAGDHVVLSYRETFDTDVSILRPFNNFGPRQNEGLYAGIIPIVVRRASMGEPIIIYGDGEQTRDFIFVRDTADAAVRIYEAEQTRGQIINVATGQELSINRLVRAILEIMESGVPVIHQQPRPGDVRRHCGGIERARKLIGFEPRTALDSGLVETVAWYKEQFMNERGGDVR